MLPTTFEFVLTLIAPKLKRIKPGYKSISPNKQFLIAIWKMATPDSYRYFYYIHNIMLNAKILYYLIFVILL